MYYEFIIGIVNFMTQKKEKSEFLKEKFRQSRLVSQNFIIFWTLGSFCLNESAKNFFFLGCSTLHTQILNCSKAKKIYQNWLHVKHFPLDCGLLSTS